MEPSDVVYRGDRKRITKPVRRLEYTAPGEQKEFANELPKSIRREKKKMYSTSNKTSRGSIQSSVSIKSSATVLSLRTQRSRVNNEKELKLVRLNNKFQPVITNLQREMEELEKTIENHKKGLSGDGSIEGKQDEILQLLQELELELITKNKSFKEATMDYEFYRNNIEREYKLLIKDIQLQEEDKHEQLLDEVDEEKVEQWNRQNQVKFTEYQHGATSSSGCDSSEEESEEESKKPILDIPKKVEVVEVKENVSNADFVNQFTRALKQTFSHDKDLPSFSGKAEEWPLFISEFQRTKDWFQAGQNASRLSKALKGDARKAVVGLLDDPRGVPKVMKLLENRFGRAEFIIDALIDKVRSCKNLDWKKPETVIEFGDMLQNLVLRVKLLKKKYHLHNPSLLKEVVSKLPQLYVEEWFTWTEDHEIEDPSLKHFARWMERKCSILVRLCKPKLEDQRDKLKPSFQRRSNSFNATLSKPTNSNSYDMNNSGDLMKCVICQKDNHTIKNCWVFKKMSLDERWKAVKNNNLCYCCLKTGHIVTACTNGKVCGKDNCKYKHHVHLHRQTNAKPQSNVASLTSTEVISGNTCDLHSIEFIKTNAKEDFPANTIGAVAKLETTPLPLIPVKIRGPKGTRKVYVLPDSGSNVTGLEEDLANEIGCDGEIFSHSFTGITGSKFNQTAKLVKFEIAGDYPGAKFYTVDHAITINKLGLPAITVNVDQLKLQYPYLQKAKLKNMSKVIPKVIIGDDYPQLTAHRAILERGEDEPIAMRTKLGWLVAGRGSSGISSNLSVSTLNSENLEQLMKEQFRLGSFGVVPRETVDSRQDQRARAILDSTIKLVGDRWECGLLWKEDFVCFPPSKQEATKRLISNERRMLRDSEYARLFHAEIDKYFKKGFIRELSSSESSHDGGKIFYVPIFGVQNPNKPGKVRVVFDAAAKAHGISLNDKLLTGPEILRPLISILWNFRRHNIAITGDVEEMFHRVAIIKADQDAQRFLWRTLDEAQMGKEVRAFAMTVMIFGATSSPTSAMYVKNVNAKAHSQDFPVASQVTIQDFYVDDCCSGAKSVEVCRTLLQQIIHINAQGGFHVKKWMSNDPRVLEGLPEDYCTTGNKGFPNQIDVSSERVLGLWWNPKEDQFLFKTNFHKVNQEILNGRRPTKREVCSLVMSVNDPLGFVNNLKVKGMIILQMIWRTGIG